MKCKYGCKEASPSGCSHVLQQSLKQDPCRVRDECVHRIDPPPKLNSPPDPSAMRFLDNGGLTTQGRTCWARVVCRGGLLTRRRAPQNGWTPLHAAAMQGQSAVVRFLVEKGADVTAKTKVSERRVGGERKGVGERRGFGEG